MIELFNNETIARITYNNFRLSLLFLSKKKKLFQFHKHESFFLISTRSLFNIKNHLNCSHLHVLCHKVTLLVGNEINCVKKMEKNITF